MKRVWAFLAMSVGLVPAASAVGEPMCDLCGTELLAARASAAAVTSGSDVFWTQGEAETNVVDVLLAFDTSARQWLASVGFDDAAAFAEMCIADLNDCIAQTGLDEFFGFRLAGVVDLALDASKYKPGDFITRATGLYGQSQSAAEKTAFQALRDARDAARADIVAVFSDGYSVSTIFGSSIPLIASDLTASGLDVYKDLPYCTVDISSVFSRYTLLHEIGHLMGAGHSASETGDPGPQLFAYSSGYYFTVGGGRYTTVMGNPSYRLNGKTWTRLPFFSSPDYNLLVEDAKTGTLRDSGVAVGTAKSCDNTRTLRETFALVANFRVATMLDVMPTDPYAISLSASSDGVAFESGSRLDAYKLVNTSIKIKAKSAAKTTIKVSGLPSGMTWSSSTKCISGAPKKSGTFKITVKTTNEKNRSASFSFTLKVMDIPSWAIGTYDGIVRWNGKPAAATVTVSTAGRVSGSLTIDASRRSFSCKAYSGFEDNGGEPAFLAESTVKISAKDTQPVTLRISRADFADRSGAVLSQGVAEINGSGEPLLQNVWNAKGFAACKVSASKTFGLSSFADVLGLLPKDTLTVRISSAGVARLSGKYKGASVSVSTRFVRLGADPDKPSRERVQAVFVIPPKAKTNLADGCAVKVTGTLKLDAKKSTVKSLDIDGVELIEKD